MSCTGSTELSLIRPVQIQQPNGSGVPKICFDPKVSHFSIIENSTEYLFYIQDEGNYKNGDCLVVDAQGTYLMSRAIFDRLYPTILSSCSQDDREQIRGIAALFDKYCKTPHVYFNAGHPDKTNCSLTLCPSCSPTPSNMIITGNEEEKPSRQGGRFHIDFTKNSIVKILYDSDKIAPLLKENRSVPANHEEIEEILDTVKAQLENLAEKYSLTIAQQEALTKNLHDMAVKKGVIIQEDYNPDEGIPVFPSVAPFKYLDNSSASPIRSLCFAYTSWRFYFFGSESLESITPESFQVEMGNGCFRPMPEQMYEGYFLTFLGGLFKNDPYTIDTFRKAFQTFQFLRNQIDSGQVMKV